VAEHTTPRGPGGPPADEPDLGARKALGQHFLRDRAALRDIADRTLQPGAATVFEIGPGRGALTDELVGRAPRLVLVEKDRRFVEHLRARYEGRPDVTVAEADATTFDFAAWLGDGERAAVAGNLPYNVAAPIWFHLLAHRARFTRLVLMFQREVAERLVAAPGSKTYGAPSVSARFFTDARIVRRLAPGAFAPPPKVWSAVVQADPRPAPLYPVRAEDDLLRFVRGLFSFRRKTLANVLAAAGLCGGRPSGEVAAEAGVDPRARAETLDAAAVWRLYRACGGA
jgi:16S rRNA (adenine1518-N6/adenine1519-N6)-dimethyltransferase